MSASKTNKDFVIVAMIEPQNVGRRFDIWPLHITLVPWFTASTQEAAEMICINAAKLLQPFTVEVGERAYFGQRKNLPVMLIKYSKQLTKLHKLLLSAVESEGWSVPGRYTGAQYKPHVTKKRGHDAKGVIAIDAIYLVERLEQGYRKIIARIPLYE